MKIDFRVEGPLDVKPHHGPHGRIIQVEGIKTFWEENPGLAEKVGCYIFGLRYGAGLIPIYVGQSKTGFRHECFQPHKLNHYNDALANRAGTPIMLFVVPDNCPQASLETCLDQVENYLIQLAVQHNPKLANVRRVEWCIPGVFHTGPGHLSESAKALRQILGVVHPVQPAVPKTTDDEVVAVDPHEQTATTPSKMPDEEKAAGGLMGEKQAR